MAVRKRNSDYQESSIRVLKGLEPVRQRPGMYTLTDNPLHIIQEVIDNASDEILAGFGTKITLTRHADASITVEDDGRGIPTGIHPTEGVPTVELVFTQLHAGGKFDKTSGGAYTFSGGLHGVGVSVTNALSLSMDVTVWREGQEFDIGFEGGEVVRPLSAKKSPKAKSATGTRVTCRPDPKYFDSAEIPEASLVRLLKSKAVLLPGASVTYVNEVNGTDQHWKYDGGLKEYLLAEVVDPAVVPAFEAEGWADETTEGFAAGEGAAWVVLWTTEGGLTRESFVNLIPTPAGGTHEAGLRDGLFGAMKAFMEAHGLMTKGVKLLAEDVFARASFVLSCKALDPQFQGQTKEKLTSRDALRLVSGFVRPQFEYWLNDHVEDGKKLAELVIDQAKKRQRQAQKVEKKKGTTVAVLPGKLTDCESTDLSRNELFLVGRYRQTGARQGVPGDSSAARQNSEYVGSRKRSDFCVSGDSRHCGCGGGGSAQTRGGRGFKGTALRQNLHPRRCRRGREPHSGTASDALLSAFSEFDRAGPRLHRAAPAFPCGRAEGAQ